MEVAEKLTCAALGGTGSRTWPTTSDVTEGDAALAEVVRRQLQRHLVTGQDTDVVFPHLARGVSDQLVAVVQRHAKTGIGKDLVNQSVHFNQLFFSHVWIVLENFLKIWKRFCVASKSLRANGCGGC